jgi:hypothetical protein
VRAHVSFFMAVLSQLQLCYLHWLVSVPSSDELHLRAPCYTSCLTETVLQSSKRINVWMPSTSAYSHATVSARLLQAPRFNGMSQYLSCVSIPWSFYYDGGC